jgi:RNA polymerase sigma factor (sigma-70 family)
MAESGIRALVRAAQHGDRAARTRIVEAEAGSVRAVAAHYRNLGLSVDDLIQEGWIGLLDAVDAYDPSRGIDFDRYARFRIRRAVRNALTEQSRLIRLPKQIVERRRALDHMEARFVAATGRTPTIDELARETGLGEAEIREARSVASAGVSLDRPALPDGSSLDAVIADCNAVSPENEAVEHERARAVDDALAALPVRQREVVVRHFGLGCASEPIVDVAAALHVSPQRVRTIERGALCALRDQLDPQPRSESGKR